MKTNKGYAGEKTREVHFYVTTQEVTSQELNRLHDILRSYRGASTVLLHLYNPDRSETIIELPHHIKINPSPELLETVDRSFGRRITASL